MINPETKEVEVFEIESKKYQLKERFKSKGTYKFEWNGCKTEIDFKKVFK